jgi:FMN hydrolase / 5-amino-6-(5-phospho-D-ribitylamino)uracil phosphatase
VNQSPRLISLDVGGTIGTVEGRGVTEILAAASPLPGYQVRRILRETLHVAPRITDALIAEICAALKLSPSDFPADYQPPPFRLFPNAVGAIDSLSRLAPVITLSNVCSLDFDGSLGTIIGSSLSGQHPSCNLGHAKPDRAAFQRVADLYEVQINSLLHIGDDWECDAIGALAAGAKAMWVSRNRVAPTIPSIYADRLTVVTDLSEAVANLHIGW